MLRHATLAVILTRIAFATPLPPQPADVPWPADEWPTGTMESAKLDELLQVTDHPAPPLGETRAVVIVHHGKLVKERYMSGFGAATPLISWSMAKSITQALLGIAVRRGLVDVDKPMGNPRWAAADPRNAIPWRMWINMVDGQDYREIGVPYQAKNDAARMLYGEGRRDVAGFAATLPLIHPPGTHWNYNSAGINLIADGLGRAFAPGAGADERRAKTLAVMKEELFDAIGMRSARPEFDSTGTFIGSALVYATARDFARFGLLYMRDGMWNGKRILPEGWVDFARRKTSAPDCDVYGAGFWVTPESGPGKPMHAIAPNAPRDLFFANGHEGQVIVIVPSKDLIVVRLGLFHDDHAGFTALGRWLEQVVAQF